jgi:polyisoprenoid-binding protein YceI
MNDRTRRWLIRGGLAVVLLVALGYGAIFFYANVLNDSPDEFDEEDLSAAVNATDPTTGSVADTTLATDATSTSGGDTTTAATSPPETSASAGTSADPTPAPTTTGTGTDGVAPSGSWQVTDASQFGYRVEEVLAGVNTAAVGRSNQIDGSLTIDGNTVTAADFTVDVASITSDESRRDDQFRGRVMQTDQFPTATFVLTEPIDFGRAPARGEQVQATAIGDLTLHGVTRSVTFEVTAEAGPRRIGVLGAIPVLFSDYGIDNPSTGVVTTEDNGLVEFVLVFERAA